MDQADTTRFDGRQTALACLALLLGLLASAPAAWAHRESASFAWISSSGALLDYHIPSPSYSHNDVERNILVDRESAGVYHVRFTGLTEVFDPYGHVQVTAYGSQPSWCQVRNWFEDTVTVVCFDTAGTPTDSPFTVMLLKEELHTIDLGWVWANDDDNPDYVPDPNYSLSRMDLGAIDIQRLGTGLYRVNFYSAPTWGDNEGHRQVSSYGPTPAFCKLDAYESTGALVRCQSMAGLATDSRFTLLILKKSGPRENMAYARIHDGSAASGTAATDYSKTPGGGGVTWTRVGTGSYQVTFSGVSAWGVDLGTVLVTAEGSDDAWCKVASWGAEVVAVRCFDDTGAAKDSKFSVLYHRTARDIFNQEYVAARAHDESSAMYAVSYPDAYSPLQQPVTFSRSGVGQYSAAWPDMSGIGSDGGAVVVSQDAAGPGHCKPLGWSNTGADVRCYDAAGSPADRAYRVLFWKPTEGAPGVAYAWSSVASPGSPYAPNPNYSHNPAGGSISIDRLSTGHYEVTWAGYGATIQNGGTFTGNPQVSAYGSSSHRCNTGPMHVDGDTIEVYCFDVAGNPVDSEFVALYVKSNRFWRGVDYSWAHLPSTASYNPLAEYSTHDDVWEILHSRSGVGDYSAFFQKMGLKGLDFVISHAQISTRDAGGDLCRIANWYYIHPAVNYSVLCDDKNGAPADSTYDLLLLKPVPLPEPSLPIGLAVGCAALLGARRLRRERGSCDQTPASCSVSVICTPTRLSWEARSAVTQRQRLGSPSRMTRRDQ